MGFSWLEIAFNLAASVATAGFLEGNEKNTYFDTVDRPGWVLYPKLLASLHMPGRRVMESLLNSVSVCVGRLLEI